MLLRLAVPSVRLTKGQVYMALRPRSHPEKVEPVDESFYALFMNCLPHLYEFSDVMMVSRRRRHGRQCRLAIESD
jgi:hypothetical protein